MRPRLPRNVILHKEFPLDQRESAEGRLRVNAEMEGGTIRQDRIVIILYNSKDQFYG